LAGSVPETKSGQTFENGNTDDSKIEAQGKSIVRLWAVNKITDASNNAINYIYNEDNTKGEYTLQRINYGNNSGWFYYNDEWLINHLVQILRQATHYLS
jgi:hypothetical protein